MKQPDVKRSKGHSVVKPAMMDWNAKREQKAVLCTVCFDANQTYGCNAQPHTLDCWESANADKSTLTVQWHNERRLPAREIISNKTDKC